MNQRPPPLGKRSYWWFVVLVFGTILVGLYLEYWRK